MAPSDIVPRGVYRARYTVGGRPVFFAVTSRGERYRQVVMRRGASEDDVVAWLWGELDKADPVPRLELVAPTKHRQIPLEELDALYRDADPIRRLLWQRRKAKLLGGTFG